jgi:tetratricopeptide (TPR) repeat protein
VAALERSERALPDDYNPPARLARALHELKRYGEALAAIDRALAKAYGPRKGGFYALRADILEAQGRIADARKTIQDQLAYYRALPDGQRRPEAEAKAEQRLLGLAKR